MFRNVLACAVASVLVVGVGYLHWTDGSQIAVDAGSAGSEGRDAEEKNRLAEGEARALIAAESRLIDAAAGQTPVAGAPRAAPRATAPPGFVPTPLSPNEPMPPAGYVFVARHEVEWGPMTAADIERVPSTPPVWMASGMADVVAQAVSARRDWTFGWVRLAEDAGVGELRDVLAAEGGRVLGQSGDLVRARLPGDSARLGAIAGAVPVSGLGAVPAQHKILGDLAQRALADSHDKVPVWITLMDDDADRRWRRALRDMGAEVGRYDPAIRTYAATLPPGTLEQVAQADYVLALESIGRLEPALEFGTAVTGADAVRVYDESVGLFSGVAGASVPVGILDSGLNLNHPDISSGRRSICGLNVSLQPSREEADDDLWWDYDGHGTQVSGIALGNGTLDRSRAGVAPLVQDIRFAKVFGVFGSSSALGWGRAMDWFAMPTDCGEGVARKALVINASIGFRSDVWEGRSVVERKIDASVSTARQLFVVSAGNAGDTAFTSTAGAKNALAVGATEHHGDIASFSSVGPTYDGRLFPKVVALGYRVATAQGGRRGTHYEDLTGTSSAAPAVAGVAALVMDAVPELREEPAAVRAHLMASAIKPEVLLADPDGFRRHNTAGPGRMQNVYGLGMVSARTAVLSRDAEDGWIGGAAAFDMEAGSHAYRDIEVPPGASRLDVVLTWDEAAAELVNDSVLHDLDLWVDRDVECGSTAACGHYQSRSRRDNVEWVIVRNPPPGTYRLKAVPNRIFGSAPRAGLAWTVIRGASTPTLAVTPGIEEIEVGPDESVVVPVTVSSDGYVASGTVLRVDCRAADDSDACANLNVVAGDSHATREDGRELSFRRDLGIGPVYALGELGPDERQTVTFRINGRPEGGARLHFTAMSWNAGTGSASVDVVVGDPEDQPVPTGWLANDDFAAAERLEGTEGETTVDLFHATAEVGEPSVTPIPGTGPRRTEVRTVWFSWTAPDTGLARFSLQQAPPHDFGESVVIDVYTGEALTGLAPIGIPKTGGSTIFLADAGTTYRIRLGIRMVDFGLPAPVLTLTWAPGVRPANDDYALAEAIEGDSGTVEGDNRSATTEPGELMGFASTRSTAIGGPDKAASVWYRWTAPSTGDWGFAVGSARLVVGVYAGSRIAKARLVSGVPGRKAVFPATSGEEYHIAVAAPNAYHSGGEFEMSWGPDARDNPGNDDFEHAQAIGNFAVARVSPDLLTVESGEPAESGARTFWSDWTASSAGRYVWRTWGGSASFSSLSHAPLQIAVFEGDELASLLPVVVDDASDQTMRAEVVFDAEADVRYRLAVGLPRDAAEASIGRQALFLQLGEVPPNDDIVNAEALAGVSGAVRGSTQYATLEAGEISGPAGDSSLWWTYEADETQWVRFAVDGPAGTKIAIYRHAANGDLELLDLSRQVGGSRREHTTVSFQAESGIQYLVRVGAYVYNPGSFFGNYSTGSFELTWEPGAPPARLRYVQAILEGDPAPDGSPMLFGTVGEQAQNADGSEHYLASDLGLMVFARDEQTGRLTLRQTLHGFPVGNGQLRWDEMGEALLVAQCGEWWRFTALSGGGLEYAGVVGGAPCPSGRVLLQGTHVIHVDSPSSLETYAFDDARTTLTLVDRLNVVGVSDAALTADGENLYAATRHGRDNVLFVMARDVETGALTIETTIASGTDTGDGAVVAGLRDLAGMVVHGSHLFLSVGTGGTDTMVFDLADRARPVFSGVLRAFFGSTFGSDCGHLSLRGNANVLDVFCGRNAHYYTIQIGPGGSLLAEDYSRLRRRFSDSFGNPFPSSWFSGAIASLGSSSDGRHLYVAGSRWSRIYDTGNGLHVFERVYGKED